MGPALPSLLALVTSVQRPLGGNQWMVGTPSLEEDSVSLAALSRQGSTAEVSVGWANVGVSTPEGVPGSSGAARCFCARLCPCCCRSVPAAAPAWLLLGNTAFT